MSAKWIWLAAGTMVGALSATWATGDLDLKAIAGLTTDKTKSASAPAYKPPSVTVMAPISRQFIETIRLNGSLVAREEILVAPQIEGQRIRELLVDTGDQVQKGQLLARLATENLDALVAQTAASIQRSEAAIAQAHSQITQAKARLSEASASLKRARPLSKSGYLSKSVLEQRQATATSANAALAIARDSLRLAKAEKVQAEAKHRELLWRLSHTDIHATADGYILSKSAKIGAIATATGQPMFRIVRAGEIEFQGEVVSDYLHRLKSGQSVKLDIAGAEPVAGTVRLVSPNVALQTRLGDVRIFLGVNPRLRVGAFATGIVETARSHGLAIPSASIMRDRKGTYVLVIDNGKIATRRVTLGLISAGFAEITKGLSENDRIVAKAGTFLGDGEVVTPIERPVDRQQKPLPKAG